MDILGLIKFEEAAISGDVVLLQKLFEQVPNERKAILAGELLTTTAANGKMSTLKYLIEQGADVNIIGVNLDSGALHWAVHRNQQDCLKYLIECGADVNLRNQFGRTAIYDAIKKNNISIVKYLFDNGANLLNKDNWSYTPLEFAIMLRKNENSDSKINPTKNVTDYTGVITFLEKETIKAEQAVLEGVIDKNNDEQQMMKF